MSLPPGEVHLDEVMGWAQEQSQYLAHPSQRLVLWYLCINAFRHESNPEGRNVGDVLSAYVPVARICSGTGLSERAVRDALIALQAAGYIIATHKGGNRRSRISVYWTEGADQMREDFRRGIKPLLKEFQQTRGKARETLEKPKDAVIVDFPNRQGLPV